jgi:photosystem II stability/assembly factor-like uncharacterized protein
LGIWQSRSHPAAAPGPASAPRHTNWRILGPGGGSAQFFPALSPHDKNLILVSSDMTGCYITGDGGQSWRMFHLRHPCRVAFDPRDANVIYAATGGPGLYRSGDRGKRWALFYPPARDVVGVTYEADEAEPRLSGKSGLLPGVTAVATDPEDSSVLYLASGGNLLRTRDAGRSWDVLAKTFEGVRKIVLDPRAGGKGRTALLHNATRLGYWDGRGFIERTLPLAKPRIHDMAVVFPPQGNPIIHLACDGEVSGSRRNGALLRSEDLGATWKDAHTGLAALGDGGAPPPVVRAITARPTDASVYYASYSGLRKGGASTFGVARSADSGETWQLVWEESTQPAANIQDPWLSEVYGPDWGENPLNMAIHPHDPNLVVATDLGRTLKTTDGGKTWAGLYSLRRGDSWTTRGIDVINCYGVHFDPFQSHRMLASCTDIGVFRSEDQGQTWRHSWQGVPRAWRNTMYWVEYDPEVKGKVWGAASRIHDLPRARVFRQRSERNWQGGVVTSEDGGLTWRNSSEGLPNAPVTHVLLDRNSKPEARVLFAASMLHGVYRSADSGRTWQKKSAGIESPEPNVWRLAQDSRGALYAIVCRRTMQSKDGTPSEGSLYRSEDRGESWQRLVLPHGVNGPVGLAADPSDANRLLLAAWGREDTTFIPAVSGGGLFLSTDRGKTWRAVLPGAQYVYDVTLDSRRPGRAYATGFTGAAWRSDDSGESWRRIPGFNFKLGYRVIPDPADPEWVFIATMGGSLWHGPAAGSGQPEEEDIAGPPQVRYDAPTPSPLRPR